MGSLMWLSTNGEAGHLQPCACCGSPLSRPHGQALESSYEDHGVPGKFATSRDQNSTIDVCAGLGIGFDCDADYADESNDRRSVSGTVVTLGGATVSWASSTQRCVVEYVALGGGMKEASFTGAVPSIFHSPRAIQ